MSPENFVYWLQGMMEIGDPKTLNEEQVTMIKNHIALVLTKVTPDKSDTPLPSPWWGVQLPRSDGYMTCTSATDLNIPDSCGIPLNQEVPSNFTFDYTIESTC